MVFLEDSLVVEDQEVGVEVKGWKEVIGIIKVKVKVQWTLL